MDNYWKLELTNTIHGTTATVIPKNDGRGNFYLTKRQLRDTNYKLCRQSGCIGDCGADEAGCYPSQGKIGVLSNGEPVYWLKGKEIDANQSVFEVKTIQQKAILVSMSVHKWTGRILDRDAQRAVSEQFDADEAAGKYIKFLVDKQQLKELNVHESRLRDFFARQTLPWANNSVRILPVTRYVEFNTRMGQLVRDFDAAVERFLVQYEHHIEVESIRLGKLFNASEYLPLERLRNMFGIDLSYMPISDGDDFRVQLDAEYTTRLREECLRNVRNAYGESYRDLCKSAMDRLTKLSQQLTDGTVKSTALNGLRQLAKDLCDHNLLDDPELLAMEREVERLLKVDFDKARKDAGYASQAQDITSSMIERMAGYM